MGEVNQPRRGRTPQRRVFEQSGQQSLCVSPCVVTYLWWVTLNGFIDAILPDLHLLQHHHVVSPQGHDPRRAAQPVPRSQGPTGRHGRAGIAGLVPGGGKQSRMLARHTALGTSGKTAWSSCAPVPKFGWWVACGDTSIHGCNTVVVLPPFWVYQVFTIALLIS